MQILREPRALRAWSDEHIARGKRIALVPTMGYLHEGHLSLVRLAREKADVVAASIFVNPTQFGPKEDLSRYPRDLEGDLAKLERAGVDAVFTPEPATMYPPGFDTYVVPSELATVLCGASRPGHFKGVCTVVHLLFRMSRCHVGVFGAKDYQQLTILRRMARDLWLDVDVVGGPIVREADGLAMSSRNVYLSANERQDALTLSRALGEMERAFAAGERDAARLVARAREIIAAATRTRVDYVEVADAESLKPVTRLERPVVCALAVFVGNTRLIDNRVLGA